MVKKLQHKMIHFPLSRAGLAHQARTFELRSLLPDCIGAIDGTHIKVTGEVHSVGCSDTFSTHANNTI